MTDRREPPPLEEPPSDDAAADDRQEPGDPPRQQTLYRILGAAGVLVLLVVGALLSALFIGLNLWRCDVGGACSDSTQNLASAAYFGGVVAGLVCLVVAFVSARTASPGRWGLVLTLAVVIPLVCLFIAVDLTVD